MDKPNKKMKKVSNRKTHTNELYDLKLFGKCCN